VGVCHEKRCVCFAGLFGWWEVEGSNCDGFGVLVLFYFSFSLVRRDHAECA
jgi:hypothetical protein